MSISFGVSEWFEDSGKAQAKYTEEVRDSIARFACEIWRDFPDFVTEGTNPLSSFSRGFMNQACSGIQTPNPPPTVPFTGGQCEGVNYIVTVRVIIRNTIAGCPITTNTTVDVVVVGAVQGITTEVTQSNAGFSECSSGDFQPIDRVTYFVSGANSVQVATNAPVSRGTVPNPLSQVDILNVVRQDGQPDTCGDPRPRYNSPPPTLVDLRKTINITNLDGDDNTYEIVYNKISNNYNFPFGFKFNGVNVTVDIGGITINGSPGASSSSGGNDVEPPGSDGGTNGEGEDYVEIFDDSEYPVVPDFDVPDTVKDSIEYLLCEEDVLVDIVDIVESVPGISPIYKVILRILANIVEELCGKDEVGELGFPEYYPVLPGTERPAVVLFFKEFVNGQRARSTYTTTITHPSSAFLGAFETVSIPDKTIGQWVASSRLTDGSRLVASGASQGAAEATLQTYKGYVSPLFVPNDFDEAKVVSFRETLQVKSVKCVQMEYYPNGRAAGVSPALLRFIDPA